MSKSILPYTSLTFIVLLFHLLPAALSIKITPIPADPAGLKAWEATNIVSFGDRKGDYANLDPALVQAEKNVVIIKVNKDGSGQFKTITDALNSIPMRNVKRTILKIGPGIYREKINVDYMKPFVTFYGSPTNMPKITFDGTAKQYGTVDSATVRILSDYFMAVNIIFENSSPEPIIGKPNWAGGQAVALNIYGDKAAFYNCKFLGFQDTLCDNRLNHFYKDCYIEGTIDFIFGSAKSIFLNTELKSKAHIALGGFITAHARQKEEEDTGFAFVHCSITGNGVNNTYLGRAWMARSKVVYLYTNMGNVVTTEGWSDKGVIANDKTVYFGEYNCKGPKKAVPGTRAKYAKILTDREARPFLDINYIKGSTWLLGPPKL